MPNYTKNQFIKANFILTTQATLTQRKTNFYLLGISRLTKNHQYYKSSLRKTLTQTFILPKFSNNTCHKVVRRRQKCLTSSLRAFFYANDYNTNDQTTERKTREKLKDSNSGTYSVLTYNLISLPQYLSKLQYFKC